MDAINAGAALSLYVPLTLYAIVSLVGWLLMKRRRSSKAERVSYWQACHVRLTSLARSHRLRAAELEIQAEKFRLKLRQEQRASRRRMRDRMLPEPPAHPAAGGGPTARPLPLAPRAPP